METGSFLFCIPNRTVVTFLTWCYIYKKYLIHVRRVGYTIGNICYYRDKTWNSCLKVKSNITCPVKVGHPLAPAAPCPHPGPRLSSASRLSPLHTTPQHSLCRNIFLFMCKQKSHLFKFSHEFVSQFYFIILSVSHLECSVCVWLYQHVDRSDYVLVWNWILYNDVLSLD